MDEEKPDTETKAYPTLKKNRTWAPSDWQPNGCWSAVWEMLKAIFTLGRL